MAPAPLPPPPPPSRSIPDRPRDTRTQRRLEAARAARRARIDRRDNNTLRAFFHRTFLQVFGLSALAGAFLLVLGGASLLMIGSIPVIRLVPSLKRASPLIPLYSFIPLSPTLNSLSPSLYGYLAKQKAEQQAIVNRYQAKEKAVRALELCIDDNLPHEPLDPKNPKNGWIIQTWTPEAEAKAHLLCQPKSQTRHR